MFELGLVFWMYGREVEPEIKRIYSQFAKNAAFGEANGEDYQTVYKVPPHALAPGMCRSTTGNEALALDLVVGANLAGKPLFSSGYAIIPASSILHALAKYKDFGTMTFQAEDEIAAMSAVLGGAYGGAVAVTASSGPGIALEGEAIGLGVMTELPVVVDHVIDHLIDNVIFNVIVIVNMHRGGPSTRLATKTEQSDLYQAVCGRNGDSPIPVLAAKSPDDSFDCAVEVLKIATKYMVPVMLLSDG